MKCRIRKKFAPSDLLILMTPLLLLFFERPASAAKVWTSAASGLWSDTNNWSGHALPDTTSAVYITNDLTKTVAIDASAVSANLTIAALFVGAPTGATNTLALANGDTNNPLFVLSTMDISPGAAVRVTNSAFIATNLINNFIDINGMVTLDGGLIFFDTSATTKVASVTSGTGTMIINSGSVSVGKLKVGSDLAGVTGYLTMRGGTLSVSGLLSIAHDLQTTGIVAVLGGQMRVLNDDLRIGDSGFGSMTVSNATLWLTNVNIGRDLMSIGTLALQTGANIIVSNDFSIARFPGSTGTVVVNGGLLFIPGQKLYAGRNGKGELDVSNGVVQADSLLVAADPTNNTASGIFNMTGGGLNLSTSLLTGGYLLSTGQVTVAGGALNVTNSLATGYISVPNGTFTFNGGNITADNLVLTNAQGKFVFNGGTLHAKGTTVANGTAFVIGNGVTPATFYLNGGIYSFANGLTISPNATLAGCGTVIGTVINNGTIATNCGISLVKPQITAQAKNGNTDTISFTTVTGQTYTLEFMNSLANSSWSSIAPSTNGTGGVMSLPDINATGSTRFYHIRTQ